MLNQQVFYINTWQRTIRFTAQVATITTDDMIRCWRHLYHISCSYLEEEELTSQCLTEFSNKFHKIKSLFRIEIEIPLTSKHMISRRYGNSGRESGFKHFFEKWKMSFCFLLHIFKLVNFLRCHTIDIGTGSLNIAILITNICSYGLGFLTISSYLFKNNFFS